MTSYLYEESVALQIAADEDIAHTTRDDLDDFSWGADPADILAAKQEQESEI